MNQRLQALRQLLEQHKLDGYIVPMADRFQSEFVPEWDRRLEWLTGFTGSAGSALILRDQAVFFTDGRYTLQAAQEVDVDVFSIIDSTQCSPEKWIEENLEAGKTIGCDAWLHTTSQLELLQNIIDKSQLTLEKTINFIDEIWLENRPKTSKIEAYPLNLDYTGQVMEKKCQHINMLLNKEWVDALVIAAPESICWLLNIRGGDLPCTPFVLSYALVMADGTVKVFVDLDKISQNTRETVGEMVKFLPLEAMEQELSDLSGKKIWLDKARTAEAIRQSLLTVSAQIMYKADPIILLKSLKNQVEVQGMRKAHVRDGAAVMEYLYRLYSQLEKGEEVTECDIADGLIAARKKQALFQSTSFDTIAGYAGNGAIVHYRARPESCATLKRKGLLLIDSGAQYLDGTTDITRTIALGELTAAEKLHYTLVLKGHIALATCVFPVGTSGQALDSLARQFLWSYGLDYNHGTGHGVGAYMNVHEGPQGISKRGTAVPLAEGMVLSNEPGCYIEGEHGIRIENLVTIVPSPSPSPVHQHFLTMETITLVPLDLSPILWEMMTPTEIDWLVRYHHKIRDAVFPLLSREVKEWVEEQYYTPLKKYMSAMSE